jgi:hypothetical protein
MENENWKEWSGLSESNRHLNLGKVREVKSNALERRHLVDFQEPSIGKQLENEIAFDPTD